MPAYRGLSIVQSASVCIGLNAGQITARAADGARRQDYDASQEAPPLQKWGEYRLRGSVTCLLHVSFITNAHLQCALPQAANQDMPALYVNGLHAILRLM